MAAKRYGIPKTTSMDHKNNKCWETSKGWKVETCLIDVEEWLNLKNKTSSIFYCNESLIAMDRK